ncbi:MAG TPA: toll/interleukin-1 receptor domain-containing protein [Acidobacteriaceae bacterium]|nr:toll/interleukin-1 receptor domain-containing protein [Acidobacteriaceae bacterium]
MPTSMRAEPHRYDVFFSYAWEDLAQATEIVTELRGEGLDVFQDLSGMRDYDEIPDEIHAAMYGSRCLVALYTPDFPPSRYCRWELYTALTCGHGLDQRISRVFALVRGMEFEEVRPRSLTNLRLPDRNAPVQDLARSITARIHSLDDRRFGDAPLPPKPPWYPQAPPGTRQFYGRLCELWDVRDALFASDDAERAGPAVACITGLGGQGKTMLAEQYALTFASDHPGGVFVLRGFGSHRHTRGDPVRLAALRDDQVAHIAGLLQIDVRGREPAWIDGALRSHLTSRGLPYLWIVDDLPAGIDSRTCAALFAPTPHGRTLVTTRDGRGYGWGEQVAIGGLDGDAALRLVTSRREPEDRADRHAAKDLAEDLGRHALGLAVAAGLAGQPEFSGYADLCEALSRPGPDVLELSEELASELPGDHAPGVAAAMLRSITRLTVPGYEVLRIASVLAPAPVPQPLFTSVLARAHDHDLATAGQLAADGLADAASRSLANVIPAETTDAAPLWTVHALVSRAMRFTDLDVRRRERVRTAGVGALTTLLDGTRDGQARLGIAPYMPHVRAVAGDPTSSDEWHLLNEAGRAHVELGDSRTALTTFSVLHEACQAALGQTDVTTLRVLSGLAVAHGLQGDHDTALALKQRAYEGLRAKLGEDHPDALVALDNIAVTYSDLGDHHSARQIHARIYRATRSLFQAQHPKTLAALSNLATAIGRDGNQQLAVRLKRSVYERSRVIHGPAHPLTLDAINNIAASHHALGDTGAAHREFAEVHRLRTEVLGPRHPDTLTALENVAVTSGDDKYIREVAIGTYQARLAVQGPGHPETQRTLRTLLTAYTRLLPDGLPADRSELAQYPLPPDVVTGTIRLDDPMTDWRVENFELACRVHEAQVHRTGDDSEESLLCRCLLAHATAALGQMDRQYDDALVLLQDSVEGLAEQLSSHHAYTRLAQRLSGWVEELADAAAQEA